MKNLWIFFLLMGLVSFACSSDDDDGGQDAAIATMTCQVDGQAWNSSDDGPHSPTGAVALFNTSMNVVIQGYAEDGSYIALNVFDLNGVSAGVAYTGASTGDQIFQGQYKPDFNDSETFTNLINTSGTLTFTTFNSDVVEGVFSFSGENGSGGTKVISSGSFEIDR